MGRGRWVLGVVLAFLLLAGFGGRAHATSGLRAPVVLAQGAAKAPPRIIRVCVRPDNVQAEVKVWAYTPGSAKVIPRNDFEKDYPGTTSYVFDPSASPANTRYLPIPYNTWPCAPKPAPPPESPAPAPAPAAPKAGAPGGSGGSGGSGGGTASAPEEVVGGSGGSGKKRAPKEEEWDEPPPGTPAPLNGPPPTEWHPLPPGGGVTEHWPTSVLPFKKPELPPPSVLPTLARGQGMLPSAGPCTPGMLPFKGVSCPSPPNDAAEAKASSGDEEKKGDGAPKTAYEEMCEQVALAGGLANLQLGEDIHARDGHKYGIPGGKNPNGIKSATAQAVVGSVLVAAAVITAGGFDKKLYDALKKGAPMLIRGGGKAAEDAADKLIADAIAAHGKNAAEDLAGALAANGTIGEYSVMARFTKGLGSRWQAHHILEKAIADDLKLGATDRIPSVILNEAEHKAMTKRLAAATKGMRDLEKIWAEYQKVYKDHPLWLAAIKPYFEK